ncbi:MAG: hypothetical protein KAH21_02095, partial [Spirochaetaceae bacterium]|nr:hypothetical protein [Spirochaetaceae bacterium]
MNARNASVHFQGPMLLKVTVGNEEWDISWFRVRPGIFSLDLGKHTGISSDPGMSTSFDVLPGTITIAPLRLVLLDTDEGCRVRVESVDEEDRQKAALRLGKFFKFPSWYGRDFVGFGSIRPTVDQQRELFSAVLDSNPQG